MDDNSKMFNRALLKVRRNRAAKQWPAHNFLKAEAAERLTDALFDIKRNFFLGLDIGSHGGEVAKAAGARIDTLVTCDLGEKMRPQVVCDEEFLPFAPNSFDLVISALSLHHVNDLVGSFIQIRNILKPDGLFLAILPGANSLSELRASITGAASEQGFALSPRLSPLIEVRDAGALLQRAGFALPVVDSDKVTIEYDSALNLMQELSAMGESNVLVQQHKGLTPKRHIAAIASHYEKHFGAKGIIPATMEFVTLTGWKPHGSQQQPLKRGSGKMNLNEIL